MTAMHVGIRHRLGAGEAVLVPPSTAHREEAAGDPDTVWIGLDGTGLPSAPVAAAGGRLAVLAEELWLAAVARGPGSGPVLDGLARAVLGEALRQSGGGGDVVDQAIAYLLRHHDQRIVIADLAADLGVSAGWLFRAFRRRTGVTPQAFLERERMTRAGHLLSAGGLSVARVAELVGFADPLYFSRAFRRHHGRPPSALRGQGADHTR
jgi:AraC family transcriptional regulator of arabinose operon